MMPIQGDLSNCRHDDSGLFLFHILGDYSITIWKKQIDRFCPERPGQSADPSDHLIESRAQATARQLRPCQPPSPTAARGSPPGEVARWWRNRSRMVMVEDGDSWRIEGADSDRHASRSHAPE